MRNHLPVPKKGNLEEWQHFIDSEIPLIEKTDGERGLLHLRNRVAEAVTRREKLQDHGKPKNSEAYEK